MSDSDLTGGEPRVLRQDLRLYPGPTVDGAPTWMLYDCLRHSYFQLDANAYAVLSAWNESRSKEALAELLEQNAPFLPSGTVATFLDFAERSELLEPRQGAWQEFVRRWRLSRSSPLAWLIHNYLFFKIPLFHPRYTFDRASHLAAPFFTRSFTILTAIAAASALYLLSRQWSDFVATFTGFISFDGFLVYLLALVGTKTIHEIAHALTAARYGCRTSSMGVAFMVVVPMLYCDVTDSWRLTDRRQRMAVDAAGIIAEIVLAIYSSLAWLLLPTGSMRTAAFFIATTSLASSVLINLNPMMRFDGYLLLADALRVPNLQSRAFAILRWHIRELLFDIRAPKPDRLSTTKEHLLSLYAVAIVCYRAIVYFGIALLVYHATFKLLGIALFTVEVGWFLVAPVTREIAMWWRLRNPIRETRRSRLSLGAAVVLLLIMTYPFERKVAIPAVLEPAAYARVFPTTAAMVQSVGVKKGDVVAAGTTLATLVSPQIDRDQALARIRLALIEAKLQRRASVLEDRAETLSLEMERKLLAERLAGLDRERQELVLKSPIDGVVRDLDPDLDAGRWIGRDNQVALVVAPGASVVRGYLRDEDLPKVAAKAAGTFVPESFFYGKVKADMTDIAYAAAPRLEIRYLSSLNGGPIAARQAKDGGAAPETAVFPVRLSTAIGAPRTVTRGTVLVDGARDSIIGSIWRRFARVAVRESGF